MGSFTIYPAIDLIEGQVVRLTAGDRSRQTSYPTTPAEAAIAFREAGASWLHVVDLDGAFGEKRSENQRALATVLEAGLPVQFGGGLRDLQAIDLALEMGVERILLGTLALRRPEALVEALSRFGPDRIAVAIDTRGDVLQTHGWTQDHPLSISQYGRQLEEVGVETAVYTAAERDGTGQGLEIDRAGALQAETGLAVIVAGGAGSLDDIRAAQNAGLDGAVVGKALHDGRLSLEEALRC